MNHLKSGLRSVLVVWLVTIAGHVCAAELLKDINTVPVPASSFPNYLGAVGSNALFVASDGTTGANLQLWASDGTIAGTHLVTANDSSPAFFGSASLLTLGARVLWTGAGSPAVVELWASDGTSAGTLKIGELPGNPLGVLGVLPSGVAIFAAATPSNTAELWRTDGTAAGTFRVAEFDLIDPSQQIAAVVGNLVYFAATTSATGTELWVTDGSNVPSHTHLEADLEPGQDSSGPFQLTAVGNALFFTAILNNSGIAQLWRRDAAGNLEQLTNEPQGASILCSTATFVFYHSIGQPGRSDGTVAGTFRLLSPPATFDSIGPCLQAGNRVLFMASVASVESLWQSDGTIVGTTQISLGAAPHIVTPLLWTGSHLFFDALDDASGLELWVTDGSAGGTHIVVDSFPGPDPARGVTAVIGASGSQVFIVREPIPLLPDGAPSGVWRADLDGTHVLRLTNSVAVLPYGIAFPRSFIANGHLFFPSASPTQGDEPSASDGTIAGTVLLRDIAPQTQNGASMPFILGSLNATTAILSADDGVTGTELWRTDGTANGTTRLADIFPGSGGSFPDRLGVVDGNLYFAANDDAHGRELWRTDGTTTGTQLVADLEPGTASASFNCLQMLQLGSASYFGAQTSATGTELWRTDGTAAGTQLVTDLVPGAAGSAACPVAVVGSSLYFTAEDSRGKELWVTDGTAAGTHIAVDIVGGTLGSNPSMAAVFQNELVFAAVAFPPPFALPKQIWHTGGTTPSLLFDAVAGDVVWIKTTVSTLYFAVRGGSTAGIYRWAGGTSTPERFITDISPLTTDTPVQLGSRIAFIGATGAEGEEIFATDGTTAGTGAMTNVSAPGEFKVSGPLVALGQKIYFVVDSGTLTRQLVRTDGTPQGTQALTQFTGDNVGVNTAPALVGGQIVFGADDGIVSQIGWELYVQRNQLPSAVNDTASVTAGQSVGINLVANDTDADGSLVTDTLRVNLLPAHGTLLINSTGSVSYAANAGFAGTDTFTYVINDDVGAQSAAATVTVTVSAPPPPPPPSPPSNSGGGGAIEIWTLLWLSAIAALRPRRRITATQS